MTQKENLDPVRNIPILEVADRLGIHVVKKKARCFNGHDNTPSLTFRVTHNTWKCFGSCGRGGDTIALVMEAGNLDFKQALDWFAENFSIDVRTRASPGRPYRAKVKKTRKPVVRKLAIEDSEFKKDPEVYKSIIDLCDIPTGRQSIDYLNSHAIPEKSMRQFGIKEITPSLGILKALVSAWGYERIYKCGLISGINDGRGGLIWNQTALLFPFYEGDYVVYIQARMLNGDPKFLNPKGVIKPMFNINRLSNMKRYQPLHICEGVPDAVALESAGLAAVAVLGAQSFNQEWVELLKRYDLVVLGDGDKAGANFTASIADKFLERGKAVKKMSLPQGMDVSDVLARSRGAR